MLHVRAKKIEIVGLCNGFVFVNSVDYRINVDLII